MTLAHHFLTLAANNAFANLRLLAACAELSDDAFAAPRPSYFGSIAATANHLLTVDWFYVDAIDRWAHHRPVNPDSLAFFDPELPFPRCAELAVAQREVDQRLIAACRAVTDARLTESIPLTRTRGVVHEAAPRMLSHLFQHQIHHRGQIHGLLSTTQVAPPQLDEFFCAGEAHLRADDLAQLGLSESDVWV
ncbi:MAG: putative damage-inducible protein DinB [Myxococcota bacterium]|jgi:uncharacterized damage-inducible protein DinB